MLLEVTVARSLRASRRLNKKNPSCHVAKQRKRDHSSKPQTRFIVMLKKSVAKRKETSSSAKLPLPVGPGSQSKGPRSETRITSDRIVATPPIRTSHGIDFLKVNYHARWQDSTFLDILEWSKKRLQETDDEEVHVLKSKGLNWNLQRTGTSKFNYRLKAGDVVLLLNRRGPEGNIPNIRLEIGSLTSQTCLLQTVNDIRH